MPKKDLSMPVSNLEMYGLDFYNEQMDGSIKSARVIVPSLLEMFPNTKSVVDIGCGTGAWLSEFKRCGVESVVGFDGGGVPADCLLIDASEYNKMDFTKDILNIPRTDLAICLEVAEHLPLSKADTLVATLCSISDVIVFSAATPMQGGTEHINEQWPSYWVELFGRKNYEVYDVFRAHHWHDDRVEAWYRQNIFIVVNRSCTETIELLEKIRNAKHPILDCVHPELFMDVVGDYENALATIDSITSSRSWKLTSVIRKYLNKFRKLL